MRNGTAVAPDSCSGDKPFEEEKCNEQECDAPQEEQEAIGESEEKKEEKPLVEGNSFLSQPHARKH